MVVDMSTDASGPRCSKREREREREREHATALSTLHESTIPVTCQSGRRRLKLTLATVANATAYSVLCVG
jgi:hypothetical protein